MIIFLFYFNGQWTTDKGQLINLADNLALDTDMNCPSNRCPSHCPSMSVRCPSKRQDPNFRYF